MPQQDPPPLPVTSRFDELAGIPVLAQSSEKAAKPPREALGIVKKPVEAVLMRPVKGKVTLQARRFFNVLLRHAQLSGPPPSGQYYRIPLPKFLSDSIFESRNLAYVVEVLNSMMSTVVNWGDTPEKFKSSTRANWKGAPLLAFAELEKSSTGSTLVFDLHPELRKRFSDAEPFAYAKVNLGINAALSSHASLALYELGERYLTSPGGASKKEPWRSWIAPLTGNPSITDTTEYKYFFRDVLKPALAEVNAIQNKFKISVSVEKAHRRVDTLQFSVSRITAEAPLGQSAPLAGLEVANLPLIGRMLQWGIRQSNAEGLVREHGPQRIQRALDYTQERIAKINSPGAYFKTLLKNTEFDALQPQTSTLAAPPAALPPAEPALSERLMSAYREAKMREARQIFEESSDSDRLELFNRFEAEYFKKCGELYRQRWTEFRASGSLRPQAFLVHPFIEWLAGLHVPISLQALFQWGDDSGFLEYREADSVES